MTVLGIESSCDETSAAVVQDGRICSNIISSQFVHGAYGGIVPELASREHIKAVQPIVQTALAEAGVTPADIDLVAATQGPGLIGSLAVGLNYAKALALGLGLPFLPVNHLEAHLFSSFTGEPHPTFPFIGLIVSGGHTLLVLVRDIDDYDIIGGTIDDAAGEAFDKVGKLLGLGYPGGPAIDKRATLGNPEAVSFPRPRLDVHDFNFSFSGLKTAVLYHLRGLQRDGATEPFPETTLNDLCASFQRAAIDVLVEKTFRAMNKYGIPRATVSGGVSANAELQSALRNRASSEGMEVFIPAPQYTTDNGAMIALLAYLRYQKGATGGYYAPAFAREAAAIRNAKKKADR